MSIDIRGILAAVESHAHATGRFDRVLRWEPTQPAGHEPLNQPGHGLTCAVWMQGMRPYPRGSGLASTSVRMEVVLRLYRGLTTEPLDLVDPEMVEAVDDLFTAYSGDFDLGGLVRNVDLMGESGNPLAVEAGYLRQDEHDFRIYTISLPMILNDVWAQSP